MATWNVSNIVVSAELNANIPLEKLAIELEDSEYNPEQFPGLIYRLDKNGPTMLIFNSGRIIATGSKSINEAKKAIEKLIKILNNLGIKVPKKYTMTVQNSVVRGKFDYNNIDLYRMAAERDNVQYDPEQFPGAIVKYETKHGEVTFLVFRTGKFVCTGAKSDEQIEEAIKKFEKEVIAEYAKS